MFVFKMFILCGEAANKRKNLPWIQHSVMTTNHEKNMKQKKG